MTATMLQEMAAEEKLSHDIYVTLDDMFDVSTFDDPAVQKLYNDLIAAGCVPFAAAAPAGITVEKLNMADLDVALAAGGFMGLGDG